MGSSDVSFDKVFSVPQVPVGPINDTGVNNENHSLLSNASNNGNKSTESSDGSIDELKDSDEKEGKYKPRFGNKRIRINFWIYLQMLLRCATVIITEWIPFQRVIVWRKTYKRLFLQLNEER